MPTGMEACWNRFQRAAALVARAPGGVRISRRLRAAWHASTRPRVGRDCQERRSLRRSTVGRPPGPCRSTAGAPPKWPPRTQVRRILAVTTKPPARAEGGGRPPMLMPDIRALARRPPVTESEVPERAICWRMALHLLRTGQRHRITGHAAEMAFFAVLTLVPSTVAVGSALGLFRTVIGEDAVAQAESAMTGAVRTLMGPDLADSVISPFVHAQLAQPRGGLALGGLLVAWWLASHLFASTGRALDAAYGVHDRRPTIVHRMLALAFALVSVLLVAITVEMMVVGPHGNAAASPVERLGLGSQYELTWSIGRGPLALAVVVA